MATIYWEGKADAVAQVTTATPGGTISTETFTLTLADATVTYTAQGGDTAALVAEGLRDAWNASTHPYFAAVTATAATGVVTLTADTAGVPFVVTGSVTGAATLTISTTTVNAGPNDWSTADNWSANTLPATNDTVIIQNSSVSILFGLDQSSVTLTQLEIDQSYLGKIGLPEDHFALDADTSDTSKPEYRQAYLAISATAIHLGRHQGNTSPVGSGRIKLDTGSNQTELNIQNTASVSADANLQPVRWIGSHASNVVNVTRGNLGVAMNQPGETATIATLNVGQRGNVSTDARVDLSSGVTLTTLNQAGGNVTLGCNVTTLEQSAGTLTSSEAAAITTAHIDGLAYFNSTGTISTLVVAPNGQADFSQDPRARTVSNCQLHKGASLNLDNGNPLSITLTNGMDFIRAEPNETTLTIGPHVRVTLSAF